jgi:hypothetical protein
MVVRQEPVVYKCFEVNSRFYPEGTEFKDRKDCNFPMCDGKNTMVIKKAWPKLRDDAVNLMWECELCHMRRWDSPAFVESAGPKENFQCDYCAKRFKFEDIHKYYNGQVCSQCLVTLQGMGGDE